MYNPKKNPVKLHDEKCDIKEYHTVVENTYGRGIATDIICECGWSRNRERMNESQKKTSQT